MPKYLAAIDLAKNELRNARVQNLATPPGSPVLGQLYYDTVENNFFFWNGTTWRPAYGGDATPAGPAGGDLFGTYPNPTVADGVLDDANIADDAAIALSKLATDPLARANHTGTQPASSISDFDTQVHTSRLDQLAHPTSAVDLNNQHIANLADPVAPQDAATKAYVDATAMGLDVKESVRVASTGNLTLSGTQTIDGVVLAAGDRVLVKDQTNAAQNGIYTVKAGTWTRSEDAASNAEVTPGMFTFVEEGNTHADSGWVMTNDTPAEVGSTALFFTQFSGAGQITAGAGMTKAGNTLDVVGTPNRITVDADSVDIAGTYIGQSSITTLGTITTGTWNGNTIAIGNGGTGATTAAQARTNLGAPSKFAVANGGTTSDTVTHNLGTQDVIVQVREVSSGQVMEADIFITDNNNVTVSYATAPTASTLRIVVIG